MPFLRNWRLILRSHSQSLRRGFFLVIEIFPAEITERVSLDGIHDFALGMTEDLAVKTAKILTKS